MRLSLIEIQPGQWIVPDHIDVVRRVPVDDEFSDPPRTEVRLVSGYVVCIYGETCDQVIQRLQLLLAGAR